MIQKSEVQLNEVYNLIRNAKNPEIQNIHQLTGRLFGRKRCAGQAFMQMMHWLGYSVRPDGGVYKSARELAYEINCSAKTIDRATPMLIEAGFDVFVKKANGAPTRHFVLNTDRFIKKMSEIFGFKPMQIRMLMQLEAVGDNNDYRGELYQVEKDKKSAPQPRFSPETDNPTGNTLGLSPDEIARNVQNDLDSLTKTLTRTNDHFHHTVQHQGSSSFLQREEALRWCRELDTKLVMIDNWIKIYGYQMVSVTISEARAKKDQGKIHKSMFGWVRKALEAKHRTKHFGQ